MTEITPNLSFPMAHEEYTITILAPDSDFVCDEKFCSKISEFTLIIENDRNIKVAKMDLCSTHCAAATVLTLRHGANWWQNKDILTT